MSRWLRKRLVLAPRLTTFVEPSTNAVGKQHKELHVILAPIIHGLCPWRVHSKFGRFNVDLVLQRMLADQVRRHAYADFVDDVGNTERDMSLVEI